MQKFEDRKLIEFKNQGVKIFGVLHLPLAEDNAPVVIFCHGLAGNKIGTHWMYVQISESLSRVGIASLRFDFRGSGDSEGEFSEMTMEGEISDALKAFDYLKQEKRVDLKRAGILGSSFGGAIAILAAARYQKVKSICLWAPVFDAKQWEEQWELFQTHQIDEKSRREMMRINGQLPSVQFYKEMFSMNLENEIRQLRHVPIQLIHGERDPLVGIEHSEKYVELRKSSPAQTKFIKLAHSDHDFTHPEEKMHAVNMTAQWFAKTL